MGRELDDFGRSQLFLTEKTEELAAIKEAEYREHYAEYKANRDAAKAERENQAEEPSQNTSASEKSEAKKGESVSAPSNKDEKDAKKPESEEEFIENFNKIQKESAQDITEYLKGLSGGSLNEEQQGLVDNVMKLYSDENGRPTAVRIDQGQVFRDEVDSRSKAFTAALDKGAFDGEGKLDALSEKMQNSIDGVEKQIAMLEKSNFPNKEALLVNLRYELQEEQKFLNKIEERQSGLGKEQEQSQSTGIFAPEQAPSNESSPFTEKSTAMSGMVDMATNPENLKSVGSVALGALPLGNQLATFAALAKSGALHEAVQGLRGENTKKEVLDVPEERTAQLQSQGGVGSEQAQEVVNAQKTEAAAQPGGRG